MHQIINRPSRWCLNSAYFLALAPPAYLWSHGKRALGLGVRITAAYWIIALLLGLGVCALYATDRLRCELPDDAEEYVAHPVRHRVVTGALGTAPTEDAKRSASANVPGLTFNGGSGKRGP